jgi:hypothetical protein
MADTQTPRIERVADGKNLLENLLLIDISTWQTSKEVFAAWKAGASVEGVNTANLGVYRLIDGDISQPAFNLIERSGNLFLDDIFREAAYKGIVQNEFFIPNGEMLKHVMAAITAGKSSQIVYSQINLETEGCNSSYGHVPVNSRNASEEKKLIGAVYGTETPGKGKQVYLLRPNIVSEVLTSNPNGIIVRACCFINDQGFSALGRGIFNAYRAVRGVRRVVAEGDGLNADPLQIAYQRVLTGVPNLTDPQTIELYAALHPRVIEIANKQLK